MPQLNSSAPGVLSDSTVSSLHGSVLSNDSISPNLSCESESVLQNTSNLSIQQLNNLSFLERVKAVSNEPDLSGIFSRGSLDDMRLKKKKRKPLQTKLNSNDSLKSSDSSSSSINISNLDDSFFKKPSTPCPKSKRKRENSRSKDSLHSLDKPLDLERNVKPPKRITKGNKENHSSRKISVNLASDSSLDSTNESLENTVNEINPSSLESLPNRNLNKNREVTVSDEKDLSTDISQDISKIDFEQHPLELEFTSVAKVPQLNQLHNKNPSRRVSVKLDNLLDDSEIEEENSINTSEKSITSSVVSISLAESDSINLDESVHDEVKVNNQNLLKAKRISVNFSLDDSVTENVACKVTQSSNELQSFEKNSLNDNVSEKPFEVPEPQLENKLVQLEQRESIIHQSSRNTVSTCGISENNYGKFSEILDQNIKPPKSALKSNIVGASSDNSDFNNDQTKPALRRSSRKSVRFSLDTRSKSSEASNDDIDKLSKGPLAQIEIPGSVNSQLNIQNSNKDKKNVPMIVERLSDLDNSSLSINISDISGLADENVSKISTLSFDSSNETSTNIQEVNDITHKKYSSDKLSKDFKKAVMNEPNRTDQASAKEPKSDKTLVKKSLGKNISNISDFSLSDKSLGLTEENGHISRDFGKDNSTISSLSLLSDEGLDGDAKDSRRIISSLSNITLLSDETCAHEEDHDSVQNSTLDSLKSKRVSVGNIQGTNKKNSESIHIPLQPEENPNIEPSVCGEAGNIEPLLNNSRKKCSTCSNLTLSSETLTLNVDEDIDCNHLTKISCNGKIKSRRLSPQYNLDDSDQQTEKTKSFHFNHHTENPSKEHSGKASSLSSINDSKNRLSVISDLTLLSNETVNLSIDPASNVEDKNCNNETSLLEIKSKRDSLNFNLEGSVNVENKTSMTNEPHDKRDCSVGFGDLGKTLKKGRKERASAISNLSLLSNETFSISENPISEDKTNFFRMSPHLHMRSKKVSVHINSEDTADEACIQEEEKEISETVPSKQCQPEENLCRDFSVGSIKTGSPCLVGLKASSQSSQLQKERVSAISNLTLLTNETLNLSLDPDSDDDRSMASNVKIKSKRISVHLNLEDSANEESDPEGKKENSKGLPEEHQPEENLCGDCSVTSGKSVRSSLGPNKRASSISDFTLLSNETVDLNEEATSDDETKQCNKTLNANVNTKRVSVHFNLEDTADEDYALEEGKENTKQLSSGKSSRSSLEPNGRSSAISNLTLHSNETLNLSEDTTYEDETNHSSKTPNSKVNAKRISVHFNLDQTDEEEYVQDDKQENTELLPKEHEPQENLNGDCSVGRSSTTVLKDKMSGSCLVGEEASSQSSQSQKERVSAISNLSLLKNETVNLQYSDHDKSFNSQATNTNLRAPRVSVQFRSEHTVDEESIKEGGKGNTELFLEHQPDENICLAPPEGSGKSGRSSFIHVPQERASAISNLTLLSNETLNLSEDSTSGNVTNSSKTSIANVKSKRVSVHFNLEDTTDEESVPAEEMEITKRLSDQHQPDDLCGDTPVGHDISSRSSLKKGQNKRASTISNLTLLSNETLNLSEDPTSDDETNHDSKISNANLGAKRVSVHFNFDQTDDEESIQEDKKENAESLPKEHQPEEHICLAPHEGPGKSGRSSFIQVPQERASAISNLTLLSNETLNLSEDSTSGDVTNSSKTSIANVKSKRVSVHFNLEDTTDEESVPAEEFEITKKLSDQHQPDDLCGATPVGHDISSRSSFKKGQNKRASTISNLTLLSYETLNLSEGPTSDDETNHGNKISNANLGAKRVSVHFNFDQTDDEESIQEDKKENAESLPKEHQPEEHICLALPEGPGKSGRSSFIHVPQERASAISNLTLLSNETLNLSEDSTSGDVTNSSKTSIANVKSKRVSVHFNLEDTTDEESVPAEEFEITKKLSDQHQPDDLCGATPVGHDISSRSSFKKGQNKRASTISNLTLLSNETLTLSEGPTSDDETNHGNKISNANLGAKRVSVHFNFDQTDDEESIQEDKKENAESLPKEHQPEENICLALPEGPGKSGRSSFIHVPQERASAISNLTLLSNETLNLSEDSTSGDVTNHSSKTSIANVKSKRVSVHFNLEDTTDEVSVPAEKIEITKRLSDEHQSEDLCGATPVGHDISSRSSLKKGQNKRASTISNLTLLSNETLNLSEGPTSDDETNHDSKISNANLRAKRVSVHFNFDQTDDEESIQEDKKENAESLPKEHQPEENICLAPPEGPGKSGRSSFIHVPQERASAISNLTLLSNETLNLSEDSTSGDVTNHSSKTSIANVKSKRVSVHFNLEDTTDEVSVPAEKIEITKRLSDEHQSEDLCGANPVGHGISSRSSLKKGQNKRASTISNLTLLSNETLNLSEGPTSDDETNHDSKISNANLRAKRVSVHFNFDQTVDEESIQEDKKENTESLPKEHQPEENLFGDRSVGTGDDRSPSSNNDLKDMTSAVSHLSLPNRALNLSLDHDCKDYTNLGSCTSNDKMDSDNCNVVDPIENKEIETTPSIHTRLPPEENLSKACLVDSEASSSSTRALMGRKDFAISNVTLLTNKTLNLTEDPESVYDAKLNGVAPNAEMKPNMEKEENKNNPLIPLKHQSHQNLSEASSVRSGESDISTSKNYPHGRISAISNHTLQPYETLKLSEDPTSYDETNHGSKTSNCIMNAKRVSVRFNLEHMTHEFIQKDGKENTELPKGCQQEKNLFGERSDGSGESEISLLKIVPKGRVSAISNLTLLSNETLTLSEDPVSDDETNHNSRSSNVNMKMKRVSVHFNSEDTSDEESLHEERKESTKTLPEEHQAEESVNDVPSVGSGIPGRSSLKKRLKERSSLISNLTLLSNETLNLSEKSDDETNHSSSTCSTNIKSKRVSVHFNFDDTAGDESIPEGKENTKLVSEDQAENNLSGNVLVNSEEASSSTKDLKGRASGACFISVEANCQSPQALKERISSISNFTLLTNETLNFSEDQESVCDTNHSNRIPNSKPKPSKASISIGCGDANVGSHGKIDESDKYLPNDLHLKEANNTPLECIEKPIQQKPRKSILRRSTRMSAVINHPEDVNFITHDSPKLKNGNAKTQKPLRKSVTFSTDATIKSHFNKERKEPNNIDEVEENEYLMHKGLIKDQSVKNIAGVDTLTSDMRSSNVDGARLDKNIKLTNGGIDSGLDKTYFVENDCMELTMMRKSIPLNNENIMNRTNYKSLFMEEDLSLANVNMNNNLDETRRTLAGMDFTVVNTNNSPFEEVSNREMSFATTINRVDLPSTTMEITGVDSTSMPLNVNNIQGFSKGAEINGICKGEQDITVSQGKHIEKFLIESHSKRNSNYVDKMSDRFSEANSVSDSPVNDNSLNIEDVKIKNTKTKCSHVSKDKTKRAFHEDLNDMSISRVSDMELTAYSSEKTMEQTIDNSKVYDSCSSHFSFDEDISSSTLIERSKTFSTTSIKSCIRDIDIIGKSTQCGDQSNNENNLIIEMSFLESKDKNSPLKIKSQYINEGNILSKAIADKSINHSAVGRTPSFNEINMVGAKKTISSFSEKSHSGNNIENTSVQISPHSSEHAYDDKGSETSRTECEEINTDNRNLEKCSEENKETKGENITSKSSMNEMSFPNSSSDKPHSRMGWTSDGKTGSLSHKEINVSIVENEIVNNSSVNLSLNEGESNSVMPNGGVPIPKKVSVHLCKSDLSNSSFVPTCQNETSSQTASVICAQNVSNKITNDSNVKFTSTTNSLNSKENCKKKRKVSVLLDSTTNTPTKESSIITDKYNSKPLTENISEPRYSEFDNENEIMDKQRPLLASTLNATEEKTKKHKVSVHFDMNSTSKLNSMSNSLSDCVSLSSNKECQPITAKDNIQKTFDCDSEGISKSTESVMASNFSVNSTKKIENINKHVSVLLEDSSNQSTTVDCKLSNSSLKDILCEEKNSFSNARKNELKKAVESFIVSNDPRTCDDEKVNRHVSVVLEDTSSQPTFADPNESYARAQRNALSEVELSSNNSDGNKLKEIQELTTRILNNKAEYNHHVSVGITLDKSSTQPTFSDITELDVQKTLGDPLSLNKFSENVSLSNSVSELPNQNLGKERNVNRHVSVALENTTNQTNLPDSSIPSTRSIEDTILKGKKSLDNGDKNKCKEFEESNIASLNTVFLDKEKNNRHVSVGITLDNMSTQPTISNLTEFDESEPLTNSSNSKNDINSKKHVCVPLEDSSTLSNIVDNHIASTRTSKEMLNGEENKSISIVKENKMNEFVEAIPESNNSKTFNKNAGSNQHDTMGLPLDTTVKSTISNLNEIAVHTSCSENVIIESTGQNFGAYDSLKTHVSEALEDACIQQSNDFENIRDNTKCLSLQHIGQKPSTTLELLPLAPPPFISDALHSGDLSKEIDPTDHHDTSNCVSLMIEDFSGRLEQQCTSTSIHGDNSSVSDKTNKTKGNQLSSRNPILTRKKSNNLETSVQRVTRNSLKKNIVSNLSIKSPNSSIKKHKNSFSKKGSVDSSQISAKILAECVIISDTEELIPKVPNINHSDDMAEPKALPLTHNSSCINSPNAEGVSLSVVSPQPNMYNLELNVTLDHSIRDSLSEALSDSNKKEICKRKLPRNIISSPNPDETQGKKPYSLRKSSPNLTQNVSLKIKRKSTYKNISSVNISSDAKTKAKKRTSKSDDTKTGKEVSSGIDEYVFIRPVLPVRKSGSLSITKRGSNCLEDDISNEDSSGTSKRKKNSDKTINELSYDTSLDMSEIPRDKRLLHKKLIYHSTPINPVLERRRKKKSNKKRKISEFSEGHSDKMIQVSKGFGMSSDTGISKVQAPICHSQVGDKSSELSTQNQRDIKRKEISPENQSSKRRKYAEEDKTHKVSSSGSGGYSSGLTETISAMDSPPLPRHHVQFRQNVQFKGITSESSSRMERNQSYLSGCSGRSYLSDSFYSSLSQINSSMPCYDISKKVKFKENISSISANMIGSSNSQNKVMISRLSQGSDHSKLTSTRNEEESERQETQNVSVALSELPSLASECLSKTLFIGSKCFPPQRRKPKLRNVETSVMPLFRKGKTQKYDFKNDLRFNIDNEPFKPPKIKFPAKWVSNELFKYLKGKLENSLKEEAPDMALRIISLLCAAEASIQCLNNHDDIYLCTLVLRKLLVKYNICPTQLEFGLFLINYTPFSFHKKLTKLIILKNLKVSDSIVHEGETIDIEF